MNETEERALQIYNNLGIKDGQTHITMMLYFIQSMNKELYIYWSKVDNEFKKLNKNGGVR